MKKYVINGFLISVTNEQDQKYRNMLSEACEVISKRAKHANALDPDQYILAANEIMKKRDTYIYEIYKQAMINGKAKRIDDIVKVEGIY